MDKRQGMLLLVSTEKLLFEVVAINYMKSHNV
jgi:hypothetical protein